MLLVALVLSCRVTAPTGTWGPRWPSGEKKRGLGPGGQCLAVLRRPFSLKESGLLFMKQELVQASGDLRKPFALRPLNCQKEKVQEQAQGTEFMVQDPGSRTGVRHLGARP